MTPAQYISEDALEEFDDYKIRSRHSHRARRLAALALIIIVAAGVLAVYNFLEKMDTTQTLQEEKTTTSQPPSETPTTPTTAPDQSPQPTPPPEDTTQPTPTQATESLPQQPENQEATEPLTETRPPTTSTQTPTQTPAPPQEPPPLTTPAETPPVSNTSPPTPNEGGEQPVETSTPETTGAPQTPLPEPRVVKMSPYEACDNLERTRVDERTVMCAVNNSFEMAGLARSLEGEGPLETLVNTARWVRANIAYDDTEYGLEQYVLTPKELLASGRGDSEDWALLEFSILAASEKAEHPVFAAVFFKGGGVHYAAGVYVNGTVFLAEPEPDPYPRELVSDYYGMWLASGLTVERVVLYIMWEVNELHVYNVTSGWNATVPYHPSPDELKGALDAAVGVVESRGFYLDCPPYVRGVLSHMIERLPGEAPVISLPYVNLTLPVDWYITHDYAWVRERVKAFLASGGEGVLDQLAQLLEPQPSCVAVGAEVDKAIVEYPLYVPNAMPETRVSERGSIIIYFVTAPRLHLNITHQTTPEGGLSIVIEGDYKPGILEIFLTRYGERFAAVVAPGWAYQGLKNIEASSWVFNGTHTLIQVEAGVLADALGGEGTAGIEVTMGGVTVYLGLLHPGS